jgi:hypothetical protein
MPSLDSNDPQEYGWGAPGNESTIVPFSFGGHKFYNGVRRELVPWFNAVLTRIVGITPGGMYQAHSSPGVDDGHWGYEDRTSRNSSSKSLHSWGLAVDLNAVQNPNKIAVREGDRFVIPSRAGAIMRNEFGGLWGGEWGDKMHLECHLSPAEARAWIAEHGGSHATPSKPASPSKPSAPVKSGSFPLASNQYFGLLEGPAESISGQAPSGSDHRFQPAIKRIQAKVGAAQDGIYGQNTKNKVAAWQAAHGL